MILFILDQSADSFLHRSIDGLKCGHNDPEPKVTPSPCWFSPSNSPKLHIITETFKGLVCGI